LSMTAKLLFFISKLATIGNKDNEINGKKMITRIKNLFLKICLNSFSSKNLSAPKPLGLKRDNS
jgi:hypothetical protein